MKHEVIYSVKTLRSGQPRPYADTEREYLITITSTKYGENGLSPWVLYGDIEARINEEATFRAQGKMYGGMSPEQLREGQRDWAKRIIRGLCQDFREKDDDDGKTGMEAHFYPTLQSLVIDHRAGTIRVLIIEPFTD